MPPQTRQALFHLGARAREMPLIFRPGSPRLLTRMKGAPTVRQPFAGVLCQDHAEALEETSGRNGSAIPDPHCVGTQCTA